MKYGYENPLSAQIELTADCNNNCIHCYNYWRSSTELLPVFKESDLTRLLANLVNNGIFYLAITGGEPMLHPKLLLTLLELTNSNKISTWINSNLTLLTHEIADKIKQSGSVLRTTLISFDPKLHDQIVGRKGAFSETISGIQLALEHEIPLYVNMVVMQLNAQHVLATGKFLNSIGVKNFSATKVSPVISKKQFDSLRLSRKQIVAMLDSLMLLKKEHEMNTSTLTVVPACIVDNPEKYEGLLLRQPCIAGKTECAISADGTVKPCVRDDKAYGNIVEENLSDIWQRWEVWADNSLIPTQCQSCKHLIKCGGGCRMDCRCLDNIYALDPYAVVVEQGNSANNSILIT